MIKCHINSKLYTRVYKSYTDWTEIVILNSKVFEQVTDMNIYDPPSADSSYKCAVYNLLFGWLCPNPK